MTTIYRASIYVNRLDGRSCSARARCSSVGRLTFMPAWAESLCRGLADERSIKPFSAARPHQREHQPGLILAARRQASKLADQDCRIHKKRSSLDRFADNREESSFDRRVSHKVTSLYERANTRIRIPPPVRRLPPPSPGVLGRRELCQAVFGGRGLSPRDKSGLPDAFTRHPHRRAAARGDGECSLSVPCATPPTPSRASGGRSPSATRQKSSLNYLKLKKARGARD
jgi:hypothetical protein